MDLSPRATGSILDGKLSPMEKGNVFILPPLHKTCEMKRASVVRAEGENGRSRASSSMPETAPGRRKTNYGSFFGDADESEDVSVWDSNAEGIRRSWRTNKTSSAGSRSVGNRPDAYVPDAESSSQWWRSGPDDDDYEDDTEDDDDEESMFSFFDLENFDVLSVISVLRWLLPAAAVVLLPWLFGGPMFLMMAFAVFPVVQKLLGLFVPPARKATLQGQKSRSRRKQGKKRFQSSEGVSSGFWGQRGDDVREEPEEINAYHNEDWEDSFLRNSGSTSRLGGWDEQGDNERIQKRVTRTNKKGALQRRRSRKEAPLFWRLLVALFPFLRSWGGLL